MRAPTAPRLPNLYLGTMTFGWKAQTSSPVDDGVASQMINYFAKFQEDNHHPSNTNTPNSLVSVDTARIYAGGDSERMLGSAIASIADNKSILSIGTKAHPSQPNGLSSLGLRSQLETSLQAMNLPSVNEYYLHQPDENHSLLESLQTLHQFVEEGLISTIGMSNYHASEVQRAFDLCEEYGLTKPSVYQGLYNPLNRCVEVELLPTLRQNGCSFVAYNPLAGGLLTGKHNLSAVGIDGKNGGVKDGRFKNNPNYLPRFYTPSNFKALGLINSACESEGISMVESSYRWLLYHSALGEEDGILIGASSMNQLEENLCCCNFSSDSSVELPKTVVAAFDKAWEIIQVGDTSSSGPFPYWRSYSLDMPCKESLDPGASYNAAKAK